MVARSMHENHKISEFPKAIHIAHITNSSWNFELYIDEKGVFMYVHRESGDIQSIETDVDSLLKWINKNSIQNIVDHPNYKDPNRSFGNPMHFHLKYDVVTP